MKKKEQTDKQIKLKKVLQEINKSLGVSCLKMGKDVAIKKRLKTSIPAFDTLIGGGIPEGQFSIIYGGKGVGKTTLAYDFIANAQKDNKTCMFLDLECSFDSDRAESVGVDISKLIVGHFTTAEEAMDTLIKLCNEKVVDLIVLDSIQAMSPKNEQETKKGKIKSIADDEMALLARKLSKFFRVSAHSVYEGNVAILLIGQIRTNLGGFISFDTLSGGHCFPVDTRILTKQGLKYHNEVKVGDIIPTINPTTYTIEYKPINKKFYYSVNEELNLFKNKYGKEFLFTDNHQMLVKKFKWDNDLKNSSLTGKHYTTILASESRRTYAFPTCFSSGNKEYNISDNELKLIGWLLTDATIKLKEKESPIAWRRHQTKLTIYQTKHWKKIKTILDNLNTEYTLSKRIRKDNRYEFRNTKPSYEFNLHHPKDIINKFQLSSEQCIPLWCNDLSDRQANVLFQTMMDADGTKRKKTGYCSAIHDGNIKTLERLAGFLITHNIPLSKIVKQSRKNCYSLYFQSHDYIGFENNQKTKLKYSGKVWDIEVDNNLHFIERKGQIIATHNSLQHWASLIIKLRRGSKVDAPTITSKELVLDKDGNPELKKNGEPKQKTVHKISGFDAVIKIEKTKIKSMPELSEIHVPFYSSTGFKTPIEIKKQIEQEEAEIEQQIKTSTKKLLSQRKEDKELEDEK